MEKQVHQNKLSSVYHCQNDLEPYNCQNCEFTTHFIVNLTKHTEPTHDNLINYKCRKCDFRTYSILLLAKHFYKKKLKKIPDPIKWLECDKCPSKFLYISNLKRHKLYKHTAAKDINWFACEQCLYKAKDKSNLRRHKTRRHCENIQWLQCKQCAFRTTQNDYLKKHILHQHNVTTEYVKWFKCQHCTDRFKKVGYLKKHVLLRHTPEEDIQWLKKHYFAHEGKVYKC